MRTAEWNGGHPFKVLGMMIDIRLLNNDIIGQPSLNNGVLRRLDAVRSGLRNMMVLSKETLVRVHVRSPRPQEIEYRTGNRF